MDARARFAIAWRAVRLYDARDEHASRQDHGVEVAAKASGWNPRHAAPTALLGHMRVRNMAQISTDLRCDPFQYGELGSWTRQDWLKQRLKACRAYRRVARRIWP